MAQDVRCEGGQLHMRIADDLRIEVRCVRCRDAIRRVHGQRVVVLHYITPAEGLVETRIYADPVDRRSPRAGQVTQHDLRHAVQQLGWGQVLITA